MPGPNKRSTSVHVAVTLRRYLGEALARLAEAGVDPDVVTTEPSAFRVFLNRVLSPQAQERPVMVVQTGESRTVLYIHWKGAPVVCREFAWGGRDLTASLAKKYQVPIPQAEQTKLDHGFVIPPSQRSEATPEQVDFSRHAPRARSTAHLASAPGEGHVQEPHAAHAEPGLPERRNLEPAGPDARDRGRTRSSRGSRCRR